MAAYGIINIMDCPNEDEKSRSLVFNVNSLSSKSVSDHIVDLE